MKTDQIYGRGVLTLKAPSEKFINNSHCHQDKANALETLLTALQTYHSPGLACSG